MKKILIDRFFRFYYDAKFFPFRKEREKRGDAACGPGFVGIQIDGLSHPHLLQALERGYLPNIARLLHWGHGLRSFQAGVPSTTPAAQAAIFYGDDGGIPAFRWFEKSSGKIISCNDMDQVQYFRERLFKGKEGLLRGGSSYSNILDGDAARSIFTVSSPQHQTFLGRFGGVRVLTLLALNPLRALRLVGTSLLEYLVHQHDRVHFHRIRPWKMNNRLFPLIRIICNVLLRELQTFGVIADIYAGVPRIYTTYSGYDELAHHFGPGSGPALKNLKYTDKRIGEILRILRHAPGAKYQLVILSDHGQTPGYPFDEKFGATLGDLVSAFLRENGRTAVSGGPLDMTGLQLGYLQEELDARPTLLRRRIRQKTKNYLQGKIRDLAPETLKVDQESGVIITYSSSLAHLYITGDSRRLRLREIDIIHPGLCRFLAEHPGIGFVMAQADPEEIVFIHAGGKVCVAPGRNVPEVSLGFLSNYGDPGKLLPELIHFASGPFCGDLILFGAYDGQRIACFDNQVGGHGSVGGEQSLPFLILPPAHPLMQEETLCGYTFLHHRLFRPLSPGLPLGGDDELEVAAFGEADGVGKIRPLPAQAQNTELTSGFQCPPP